MIKQFFKYGLYIKNIDRFGLIFDESFYKMCFYYNVLPIHYLKRFSIKKELVIVRELAKTTHSLKKYYYLTNKKIIKSNSDSNDDICHMPATVYKNYMKKHNLLFDEYIKLNICLTSIASVCTESGFATDFKKQRLGFLHNSYAKRIIKNQIILLNDYEELDKIF